MNFTPEQLDLLFQARTLARTGCGMVIQDDAYPEAHALLQAGWLTYDFEANGDMSWWWSPQAETALDLNALTAPPEGADLN